MAIWGGGLAGLGLGLALAWVLLIFEQAHPQQAETALGTTINLYTSTGWTVFVIVALAGPAVGFGLGLVVASLIPDGGRPAAKPAAPTPGAEPASWTTGRPQQ
jgi:hypothetical protein